MYGAYPKISFKILASENEKSFLQKYFESEEICTWDMVTLEKEFSSRDLLITGDTVTMHLAAQKSAQIIEIALGSSDPWKTGPWASDHYILTSKVACYPCVHSSSCRQISHLCSEPISPKIIKSVIDNLIEKKPILGSITGPLRVLKSQVADYGYELVSENSAKDLRVLNKILWQKIMDPGTEISSLDSLNFGFTVRGIQDLQAEMNEILYILQMDFENLVQRLGADNLRLSDVQEARRKMGSLSAAEANQEWVWMFKDLAQLSFTTPLHFLSAYQDRLEILKGAIFYRNEMMAKPTEGFNESGSRTVPKNSLAEA